MSYLSLVRARVTAGSEPDRGSTLVAAVAVGFIAMALGSVVISSTIGVNRDSGKDRQRTAQVHAAEAGIDRTYYTLQTGTLPCAPSTSNVGGAPDTTTVTTTVTYFDAVGSSLGCPGTGVVPAKAVITSVSTSSNSVGPGAGTTRKMESEVLLSPSSGGNGYAIYSAGEFTVPNSFNLKSDGAQPADVYARGGFRCENSATINGSVFSSQGGATIGNSCTVLGDLYVRNQINQTGPSSLGSALSSQAGLSIASNSRVQRDATVKSTVTGTPSSVLGTRREGQVFADPLDQPLPWIGYDAPAWSAAGFAVEPPTSDCESLKSKITAATVPTVFYGSCRLSYANNNSGLKLKTDVAVFLRDGMSISNQFGMASDSSSQSRKLWIIHPAGNGSTAPSGWSPSSCPTGDISFGNQTDIDKSINVFLYSCRLVDVANNSQFSGQVYGAQVNVSNSLTMAFVGLPPIGVDLGGTPALPGYKVEVVYKRETR